MTQFFLFEQGEIYINDGKCRIIQRHLIFNGGIAYGIDCLLTPPSLGGRCDKQTAFHLTVNPHFRDCLLTPTSSYHIQRQAEAYKELTDQTFIHFTIRIITNLEKNLLEYLKFTRAVVMCVLDFSCYCYTFQIMLTLQVCQNLHLRPKGSILRLSHLTLSRMSMM